MNNLRKYRVKKLMTQKDLSKAGKLTQVTISFIENNLQRPSDLTMEKLSRALKEDVETLFPGRGQAREVRKNGGK